jgi:predicted small metal-binding protein
MQMVAAHAAHTHGITEITPELAAKVRAAIQDSQSD